MIKEEMKAVYTTSDGTPFEGKDEALAHEAVVQSYDLIDEFIKDQFADSKPRHRSSMRRYILQYIHWAKTQELQPKETEVKPTATPAAAAKPATGKGKAKAA